MDISLGGDPVTRGGVTALVRRRMREPPRGGGGNGNPKTGQFSQRLPQPWGSLYGSSHGVHALRGGLLGRLGFGPVHAHFLQEGQGLSVGSSFSRSSGCVPPQLSYGAEPGDRTRPLVSDCWVGMGRLRLALFTPTFCEQTGQKSHTKHTRLGYCLCSSPGVIPKKKNGIVSASASHSWEEACAPGRLDFVSAGAAALRGCPSFLRRRGGAP